MVKVPVAVDAGCGPALGAIVFVGFFCDGSCGSFVSMYTMSIGLLNFIDVVTLDTVFFFKSSFRMYL